MLIDSAKLIEFIESEPLSYYVEEYSPMVDLVEMFVQLEKAKSPEAIVIKLVSLSKGIDDNWYANLTVNGTDIAVQEGDTLQGFIIINEVDTTIMDLIDTNVVWFEINEFIDYLTPDMELHIDAKSHQVTRVLK